MTKSNVTRLRKDRCIMTSAMDQQISLHDVEVILEIECLRLFYKDITLLKVQKLSLGGPRQNNYNKEPLQGSNHIT